MIAGISPDLPRTDHLPASREWVLRVARVPIRWLFRWYWRAYLHGAENVPRRGPVILAANHIGFLDGPVLVSMTQRLTFAMAKQELFVGRQGTLLAHIGQIGIDRRWIDKHAILRSIQVLRAGKMLAVFPEGARGAGEVTHAKGGAAYLAMVTGAPIVPVAILGTREPGQTRDDKPRRGAPIHVVYGEPIRLPQYPWPRRKAVVAELTEQVRQQLAAHVEAAQALTGLPLPGPPKPRTLPPLGSSIGRR